MTEVRIKKEEGKVWNELNAMLKNSEEEKFNLKNR